MSMFLRLQGTTLTSFKIDKRTVFTGVGAPDPSLGSNGDLYFGKTNTYQKVNGTWHTFMSTVSYEELKASMKVRQQLDATNAQVGSMTLLITSQLPNDFTKMLVSYSGVELIYGVDYTVTVDANNATIAATASLNHDYGGNGTDGLGFSSDDTVTVFYEY